MDGRQNHGHGSAAGWRAVVGANINSRYPACIGIADGTGGGINTSSAFATIIDFAAVNLAASLHGKRCDKLTGEASFARRPMMLFPVWAHVGSSLGRRPVSAVRPKSGRSVNAFQHRKRTRGPCGRFGRYCPVLRWHKRIRLHPTQQVETPRFRASVCGLGRRLVSAKPQPH
jgi:hypothetical protein